MHHHRHTEVELYTLTAFAYAVLGVAIASAVVGIHGDVFPCKDCTNYDECLVVTEIDNSTALSFCKNTYYVFHDGKVFWRELTNSLEDCEPFLPTHVNHTAPCFMSVDDELFPGYTEPTLLAKSPGLFWFYMACVIVVFLGMLCDLYVCAKAFIQKRRKAEKKAEPVPLEVEPDDEEPGTTGDGEASAPPGDPIVDMEEGAVYEPRYPSVFQS